ncbi:Acetyltransferase (GNAT) family protein [Anaerocolumna jejuensis DSM 15929]|uniref:Acetyltransferase (GNAT) family protein n=1 Tax=Anaerocolumna jejuensis DSM 15929 TaxID=1121322 RepID=A0A1M6LZ77_9FIRM|nr:GNAT family N-acetyltransferase [Anaerocolumna jejuensis]SHJ76559.1 Acetyltransferase (GNAT) family protein [Anaerocolumna jejuensis DSM 15929]
MNRQIICKPLDPNYIEAAVEMAQENYDLETQSVTALGRFDNRAFYQSKIKKLFENGIGRIAFQNNEPVGFLAFNQIFNTGNGIIGATSPLYGYGIRNENRGKVIGHLFQAAAAEICEKYARSLRINVYAHDTEVLNMYIMGAFSMDTTEVVRNTAVKIPSADKNDFIFAELDKTQVLEYRKDVIELYRNLINHLRVSPIFYHCNGFLPIEDRYEDFLSEDMRIFAVFHNNQLVGMIDSEPTDIEFAKTDSKAIGMGDVFIKSNYRGCGLGAALLAFANNGIRESGIDRVFVTHGTINPTARGFWDKYFVNYAYTMTRQIDPEMLGIIKAI